jgi:membrane-associated protease RseP (regulator of RpoE activity)
MFFLLVFLAVFAAGTLLLAKTSAERQFIVFMIRTKHFLRFIDSIARINPEFWKFIADFAIVISFSGLGAAYLSKYRGDSRNLDVILLFFGILAVLVWAGSLPLLILMLAVLLMGISSLSKLKNPGMDFIVATSLISSILLNALPWYLAVFEGVFGLLAVIFGSFIEHAFAITSGESTMPGVSPIIPWIEEGEWGFVVPGIGIFIPLIYGLISLIILLVVHEFSHGILARAHKLKLKSTGLLTVGPIPVGAFVEPDEEKFREVDSIVKMRVLSMGSFSNLVLSVIAITLFMFLILPSDGWVVADSNITSIRNGTMVTAINNISLSPTDYIPTTVNAKLFSNKISRINGSLLFENKSEINVTTNEGIFQITPDRLSGLGLRYEPDYRFNYEFLGFNIVAVSVTALFWIFFFNINVGLANLLPIVPFDGGKMIVELMSMFRLGEESVKKIVYAFLLIGLLIILINAYPLLDMLFEWFFQAIDQISFPM